MLLELEGRSNHRDRGLIAGHASEALLAADGIRQLLAVALIEQGLVIVEVQMGGAAGHEEVNDALGLGGLMRTAQDTAVACLRLIAAEQVGQGDAAQAVARARQPVTAIEESLLLKFVHGDLGRGQRLTTQAS
jgi:hypothetical protein